MLNSKGVRELAYVVKIDNIIPIEGADRVEQAIVSGWRIMVRKGQFQPGDYAVYFEIDSKVPEKEPFMFLESKHFKIKTQKYFKGTVLSQGLLMGLEDFEVDGDIPGWVVSLKARAAAGKEIEHEGLTEIIGVTYSVEEDNKRKAGSADKYKKMAQRNGQLFSHQPFRWLMRRDWGKKLLFIFFGRKKDNEKGFPTHFPGVNKTDQERAENMVWVLEDKTPFIVTQKCDGSSGTYILERKGKKKFEFYVCSRNVRMRDENQECFYGSHNYYWEVAKKYDIENKMRDWLNKHPEASFVCWQGEICAPKIQGNPHKLTETHFYCFHWTDSINGRLSIVEADKIWKEYQMEVVPIISTNYILPNDFKKFKLEADGLYDASVCEGHNDCAREGFVYYKTTDPNFSFKNVSRLYLLNH
jgi:hypothetical protein